MSKKLSKKTCKNTDCIRTLATKNKEIRILYKACDKWQKTWDHFSPMNADKNLYIEKLKDALRDIYMGSTDSWAVKRVEEVFKKDKK